MSVKAAGESKVDDLQRKIRVLLNVDEQTSKRLRSIESLRTFFVDPQNQAIVLSSYDKLLATLRQLFHDRVSSVRLQTSLLLGLLGTVIKQNILNFIRWVFANLGSSKKDKKLLFLSTLKEFLSEGSQSVLRSYVPVVLTNICAFLESIEHYELLVPTIEIIQFLSTAFPQVFASHFRDIIDFLVGWRLDPSLPESVSIAISTSFKDFHPFWVNNKVFSIDLLSKFITDMFHLADKEKKHAPASKSAVRTAIPPELFCFLSCFEEIVKGIGSEFITQTFEGGNNLIVRLLLCFKTVHESYHDPGWALEVNRTLLGFAELFGEQFGQFYIKALDVLASQLVPLLPTPTLRKILSIHLKLLNYESPRLSLGAVTRLLSSDILDMRLHPDPEITAIVLQLFKTLMATESQGDVVQQVVATLTEELAYLHTMLTPQRSSSDKVGKSNVRTGQQSPSTLQRHKYAPPTLTFQKKGEIPKQSISAHRQQQLELILYIIWSHYHPINDHCVVSRHPVLKLSAVMTICNLAMIKQLPLDDPNLLSLLIEELNSLLTQR